ncbi:MAG: hypothetical protein WC314_03400 [Vulcanimicrobiota bacterium]
MPIVAAVLTLSRQPESRQVVLDFLEQHHAIEVGEPQLLGLPVVLDCSSRTEERALWAQLEALPGVVFATVVFSDFSDLVEREEVPQ